jgi:hypothetical protein
MLTAQESVLAVSPAHIEDMLSKVDGSVPEGVTLELKALLNRFSAAFSVDE